MRIIPVQNTIFRHLTQDGRGHTPATVKDQDPKIRSCRVSNTHIFFVFISCFKGPSRNQKQETLLFFLSKRCHRKPPYCTMCFDTLHCQRTNLLRLGPGDLVGTK